MDIIQTQKRSRLASHAPLGRTPTPPLDMVRVVRARLESMLRILTRITATRVLLDLIPLRADLDVRLAQMELTYQLPAPLLAWTADQESTAITRPDILLVSLAQPVLPLPVGSAPALLAVQASLRPPQDSALALLAMPVLTSLLAAITPSAKPARWAVTRTAKRKQTASIADLAHSLHSPVCPSARRVTREPQTRCPDSPSARLAALEPSRLVSIQKFVCLVLLECTAETPILPLRVLSARMVTLRPVARLSARHAMQASTRMPLLATHLVAGVLSAASRRPLLPLLARIVSQVHSLLLRATLARTARKANTSLQSTQRSVLHVLLEHSPTHRLDSLHARTVLLARSLLELARARARYAAMVNIFQSESNPAASLAPLVATCL
jgi:hypothetical protein